MIIDDPEGDRILTSDLFLYTIATGLYATDTWAAMSSAIADVHGDGAKTLMSLVDRQIGRQPDGTYDNSTDAQTMVNCSDTLERPTFPDGWASASQVAAASPTFGPLLAPSAISCVDWPKPANPLPEISAPDAPPILVVGTLGDPATPYSWAQEMTAALGPKTSLLTYEGDGHTAFLRGGKCIEDSVVSYLVDLKAPKADTSCPAQSDDSGFGGIRDVLITQLVDSGCPSPGLVSRGRHDPRGRRGRVEPHGARQRCQRAHQASGSSDPGVRVQIGRLSRRGPESAAQVTRLARPQPPTTTPRTIMATTRAIGGRSFDVRADRVASPRSVFGGRTSARTLPTTIAAPNARAIHGKKSSPSSNCPSSAANTTTRRVVMSPQHGRGS